jgi:hypothetical protein
VPQIKFVEPLIQVANDSQKLLGVVFHKKSALMEVPSQNFLRKLKNREGRELNIIRKTRQCRRWPTSALQKSPTKFLNNKMPSVVGLGQVAGMCVPHLRVKQAREYIK